MYFPLVPRSSAWDARGGHSAILIQTTTGLTTVSECFGLDEWMTRLILQVSAPGLHQLLACDLVQNLVYLVQLHHCTKARYAYGESATGRSDIRHADIQLQIYSVVRVCLVGGVV